MKNKKCIFENNGNLCFMKYILPNSNLKTDCNRGCFFKKNTTLIESYGKIFPEKYKEFIILNKKPEL